MDYGVNHSWVRSEVRAMFWVMGAFAFGVLAVLGGAVALAAMVLRAVWG